MEFVCDSKYIVLPAGHEAKPRRLLFYVDGRLVYDLLVALEYEKPDYLFPVNLERFMGYSVRVECDADLELHFEKASEIKPDYAGEYRPLAHFTANRGWINDPNGLIFYKDRYFMFFQHNPTATTWENMHWGLAVSRDLMHWQERGDVIFPDENGTIFSGSGLVDTRNTSGLQQGSEPPLLFFYTSAGNFSKTSAGKRFTQRLVYSLDGGETFIKYPKPLIEHIVNENRDPKVIYYEPENCYIMALFLDEHEFALFRSDNLLDWCETQRLQLPSDAECPDFYELRTPDGGSKWVFSAASDRYYIGSFDGRHFTPESEELRLNYGSVSYAAQSWSGLLNGRRVRTAFVNSVIPYEPFGCCMDIPQEMSLKNINGALRLCAEPVAELASLYAKAAHFEDLPLTLDKAFRYEVGSRACDISFTIPADKSFSLSLFGLALNYDASTKKLICAGSEATVQGISGLVELRILFDTMCAELFADGGSVFMGIKYLQDKNLNTLSLWAEETLAKVDIAEISPWYIMIES